MCVVYFIYSEETASSNIANSLRQILGMEEVDRLQGLRRFSNGSEHMLEINGRLVNADFLDDIIDGAAIFLSRHSSNKGISAFTVHPEGNWSDENSLGGRPRAISISSPSKMLGVLQTINKLNSTGIKETYEATHHGPLLNHPSFFVEIGGNDDVINSKEHAEFVANAIAKSLDSEKNYDRIAVGIGGTHYPDKFTRLAIEGKYAFAHIMPKYYVSCTDMLKSAFERSDERAEIAVIEWKSIKANERERIVRELDTLGIDYAKV